MAFVGFALLSGMHLEHHIPFQNTRLVTPRRLSQATNLCGAIIGATGSVFLLPNEPTLPTVIFGAIAMSMLGGALERSLRKRRGKKRNMNLDRAISDLLQQLHLKLLRGKSLHASLIEANGTGNRDVTLLQSLLRSGMDIETAVSYWRSRYDPPSKQRFCDLISAKTTSSEMLSLISASIHQMNKEQHFAMVAEIERRNQLVWIPVTIAVLIPGMIFIAIPLEATLRSLLN